MSENDLDLLRQFAREQSQDAFTELVNRHLNLVYSAALRQVRSPQLAEEVSQSVFANLACNAGKLSPDTILTAWLYQVTRHTAIDVVRREARRQAREQIAFQMSDMNDTAVEWTHIEPLLDEAMQSLDEKDRAAILLRYFENKSLREVGEALGASEDAAQKRVSRAIDHLRESLSKREVTVGATVLAALVSANAIQAAPSGLVAAVATGAVVASTTISASVAVSLTKTIAMTTLQKTIVATVAAAALVTASLGLYQAHVITNLREQVQTAKQQLEQQAVLKSQVQDLQRERDRATNALAALAAKDVDLNKKPNEVLKLRGEVGRLRKENADIGSTSALSKVTANPEARKMLRDQQKLGMNMIYKGFAQRAKLTSEQTEKLNDLLADHIMDNVDHVTTVLRDKPTLEQLNQVFAAQDAVLQEKVGELLGQDSLAQYQDYTKGLLSTLTAEQFKSMLTGTDASKDEKSKQFAQVLQEEVQAALAAAGLPADYQTVPMLNFRNIASEQEGDRSLQLLEDIYQRASGRAGSFLSPDELAKFQEFKTTAIKNNRTALTLNRTMMAPIAQ
jgi:RNA polymerase sigma factor (sigma-70 family)